MAWPWGAFAHSHYQRAWDAQAQGWRQKAVHRQRLSALSVQTEALIVPQLGYRYISASTGSRSYTLQATHTFQRADMGVPAWEAALQ